MKNVDFSGIWTRIDGVEGRYADHLTTTTTAQGENNLLGCFVELIFVGHWEGFSHAFVLPKLTDVQAKRHGKAISKSVIFCYLRQLSSGELPK